MYLLIDFSKNRPLCDSFIESQCWFIYLSVCLSVPFSFCLGLSLALRSNDQVPASHWSTPPPGFSPGFSGVFLGFSLDLPRVFLGLTQGFPVTFHFFFLENHSTSLSQKKMQEIMQPLQNSIGPTSCISRKILWLPYAGFLYSVFIKTLNMKEISVKK